VVCSRVHPLAAQRYAAQVTKQGRSSCLRHCGHQTGRGLLHIALEAARTHLQDVVQGVEPMALELTIKVRSYQRD
jgi:hypothetical protein